MLPIRHNVVYRLQTRKGVTSSMVDNNDAKPSEPHKMLVWLRRKTVGSNGLALSAAAVGRKVGLERDVIREWEKGEVPPDKWSYRVVLRLAMVLGSTPEEIMGETTLIDDDSPPAEDESPAESDPTLGFLPADEVRDYSAAVERHIQEPRSKKGGRGGRGG